MMDDDDVAYTGLRLLPPEDVSVSRARRLRGRCHDEFVQGRRPNRRRARWSCRRCSEPGAWIYLIGMLRAAAAVYSF